jgi:predicted DNA-binding WGR domain protein
MIGPTAAIAASAKPASLSSRKTATTSEPTKKTHGTEPPNTPAAGRAEKRYFEFVEGTSSKFWEISVDGTDVTVRFGRIGTGGQTKTKSFGDESAAQSHAEKLVEEKTGKGYVEKA